MRTTKEREKKIHNQNRSLYSALCLDLHLKDSTAAAQTEAKRNDYSRMSQQWFDYDCSTHKVSGVSVKSGGELEAAAASKT